MPCYLCHALLCHAMPCHAMLCYALPCHAMPCSAMLCYAMPCHAMPCRCTYLLLCVKCTLLDTTVPPFLTESSIVGFHPCVPVLVRPPMPLPLICDVSEKGDEPSPNQGVTHFTSLTSTDFLRRVSQF
jgi:hypothetical protein